MGACHSLPHSFYLSLTSLENHMHMYSLLSKLYLVWVVRACLSMSHLCLYQGSLYQDSLLGL